VNPHLTDNAARLRIALLEAGSRGELADDPDHVAALLAPAIAAIAEEMAAAESEAAAAQEMLERERAEHARERERLVARARRAETETVRLAERPAPSPLDRPFGFYLYFLWSEAHELLYVGMSTNLLARLGKHVTDPFRRQHVASISLVECEDERQLRRLEIAAIQEHRPPWNIADLGVTVARG
jgi:hypothetical protein